MATASPGRPANPRSPIADGGFPLAGPSEHPDPATHAYRQDLADVALAGRVVAPHYAEPLLRHIAIATPLRPQPDDDCLPVAALEVGDELRILDNSRGWAWGYGPGGNVGYVRSDTLVP
ncbi:MAG TPA: SH3 domain-containing protein [Sphingomicrobium sp.]|nr:SH3 domain-containing protein [Sphingomicrobium sp.]